MATVNVKFFRWDQPNGGDLVMGIDASTPETFTSSGSSQATTFAAKDDVTYVRIVSTHHVYVSFGATPVAVSGQGTYLVPDVAEYFKLPKGYKVAIIN